jgi:hypothetical protein
MLNLDPSVIMTIFGHGGNKGIIILYLWMLSSHPHPPLTLEIVPSMTANTMFKKHVAVNIQYERL